LVRKVAAALWTAWWLVVLLVGMPYALLVLVGIRVPRHPPQDENLREWIVLLAVLFLWVIWLLLLALVGLHVRAAVGRVRLRRLRLANPPEGLAAGLLGAAVVAFTTAGSRGTITTPPTPAVADLSTQHGPSTQAVPAVDTTVPDAATSVAPVVDPADRSPVTRAWPADTVSDPRAGTSGSIGPAAQMQHAASDRGDSRSDPTAPGQDSPDPGRGAEGRPGQHGGHSDGDGGQGDGQGGVALPGAGWVSQDLAAAVSSAAGLVWFRRRRRYRPQPLSVSRVDGDLTALPDTAAAIIAAAYEDDPSVAGSVDLVPRADASHPATARYPAVARDAAARDAAASYSAAPSAAAPYSATPPVPAAAAAGLGRRGDWPVRLVDLPAGGTGLIGAGATDAARGILTAALLSNGPARSDMGGQVVTTTVDLATLLDRDLGPDGRPAGLTVCTGFEELLEAVETQLLHRARTSRARATDTRTVEARTVEARTTEAPTAQAQLAGQPAERPNAATVAADGPWPPLLVLTGVPTDARQARRLAVLLSHPTGQLGIVGVLLGTWRYGATWPVEPDGRTHPGPGSTVNPRSRSNPAGTIDPAGDVGSALDIDGRGTVGVGARLCVLSASAAADLLALQALARPDHQRHREPDRSPPTTGQPAPATPDPDLAAGRVQVGDRAGVPLPAATSPAGIPAANALGGPLRLRLLGGVDLHHVRDSHTPLRLGRSAARQILVFLALRPQGATSAELAAAVWPGVRPYPTARVYTAASTLRTEVARVAGVEILARSGERYQLNHPTLQVDLWQLHDAVNRAATAPDPHTRTAALHTITRLYTGELAAGQPWPWLPPHREVTRRRVLDAYTALADAADAPTAATLLDAAVAVDPLNEDLHRRAIRAHLAAGQPTQAARVLADLTTRLAAVGEQPEPATTGLAVHFTP
jgi:DNA-binding SARP family transcriptional activator